MNTVSENIVLALGQIDAARVHLAGARALSVSATPNEDKLREAIAAMREAAAILGYEMIDEVAAAYR